MKSCQYDMHVVLFSVWFSFIFFMKYVLHIPNCVDYCGTQYIVVAYSCGISYWTLGKATHMTFV